MAWSGSLLAESELRRFASPALLRDKPTELAQAQGEAVAAEPPAVAASRDPSQEASPASPVPPEPAATAQTPEAQPARKPGQVAPQWPLTADDLPGRRRMPSAKADAQAPPPAWPASELLIARAQCAALLKDVEAVAIPLEPLREGDCGAPAPVQLMAIGKGPQVVISPPAIVTCEMVVALAQWIAQDLQPSARRLLGSPVVKIENMSSYSCRNAYGRAKTRLSEHGRANALDIRGFLTASGQGSELLADWGPTMRDIRAAEVAIVRANAAKAAAEAAANAEAERKTAGAAPGRPVPAETGAIPGGIGTLIEGAPRLRVLTPGQTEPSPAAAFGPRSRLGGPKPAQHPAPAEPAAKVLTPPGQPAGLDRKQRFLRDAHASACRIFKTVLGPEANNAHRNHFHLDMASRASGTFCE